MMSITPYLSNKLKNLSFILILMVVFLHAYNRTIKLPDENIILSNGYSLFIQNAISNGFTRIAVPFFFLISGFLFFHNYDGSFLCYLGKLRKRFYTLLIPYFLWSVFGIVFYYLLQSIPFSAKYFRTELINDLGAIDIFRKFFLDPIPYQLWFVRDLVVIILISPIIQWLLKSVRLLLLIFLGVLWILNFDMIIFSNEAILFFSIGGYFSISDESYSIDLRNSSIFLIIAWIVIIILKTSLIMFMELPENQFVNWLHKFSIFIGILAVWGLYDKFYVKKKTSRFSNLIPLTFFLYASHEPVLTILKKVLFSINGQGEFSSLFNYFLAAILTILICIAVGQSIRRYFPFFFNLVCGGR